MRGIIAAILTAVLVVPAVTRAETSSIRAEIERVGQTAAGPLHKAVNRESRVAATFGRAATRQTPIRQRNWAARHPVLLGTLAGAGVGLGVLAAQGCSSSDYTCPGLVAFFGGTGAGLGAAAGAVVGIFLH